MKSNRNKLISSSIITVFFFIVLSSGFVQAGSKEKLKNNTLLDDVYKNRRQNFIKRMDGGIAIFPGNVRNEYHQVDEKQTKYFYYLTGIKEDSSVCILDPESKEPYKLILAPFNIMKFVFSGKVDKKDSKKKKYGADRVYADYNIKNILEKLIKGKKKIYYNMNNKWLAKQIRTLIKDNQEIDTINAKPILDEMRIIKDKYEIKQHRDAIRITSNALNEAFKFIKPGAWEYQVEALIEYVFRSKGAQGLAFPSITGSGPRATILHYEKNEQQTKNGELILMDVGAELNGYTADITRTVPVNGKFSKLQKEIYSLVLKAQKEAIKIMLPGRGFKEGHNRASEIIMNGLYKLGLVTDPKSRWQKRVFVLYTSSHYIGLDVHDVGKTYGNGNKGYTLKPGMLLTIEPGIYIQPQLLYILKNKMGTYIKKEELDNFIKKVKPVFEKYKGIGVRIEDDILITEKGNEILSKDITKEITEIEALMKKESSFK